MPDQPYTDAELAASVDAIQAFRHFIASDGYPAIRIGTSDEEARAVLAAVAPLIAARVRERAAQDILAHADKHAPANGNEAQRRLRRHLGIAARVAAGNPSLREIAAALLDDIARAHRTTPEEENHA